MAAENPYLREAGYARRYRDQRFAAGTGEATHRREVAAVRRLLAEATASGGPWLDVPCGTGRLTELLPGPAVQVDRDLTMLRTCPAESRRACASVMALPWADGTFEGALCMRLLHHLQTSAERTAALAELRRVTRGPIVVSFFHALSVQHGRRLLARRLGKRRSGRGAITARRFRADLAAAGLRAARELPLRRFLSEQWLVLATPS